jgi:tricorn protease
MSEAARREARPGGLSRPSIPGGSVVHCSPVKRSLVAGRLLILAVLFLPAAAPAQTRLLRFPAIHGDRVAFTYAGDLWTAPVAGGAATRLTAHPGIEVFAHFSPDGKWIAFTGQYDGDEQVYVVPAAGGEPKQLTWYPARGPLTPRWGWDNQVYGWTTDGKSVLFRSMRDGWTLSLNRLYTVPVGGGPAEALPMPEAGAGDYSPDGTRVVYSPIFRDFRPEKRYGGGMANDLFVYDTRTNDAKRIIDDPRSDRDPMWIGGAVYFNSDRDGTFNLYAYDVTTAKTTQLTHGRTWDVRWPSSDRQGRIVYELNGELQVLDVKSGQTTPVSITVPDDGLWKRPSRIAVAGQIEDWDLSPKGERALFTARGDVFTAPIEKGPTRNLTHSSGAHDKWAGWSPDGSKIAFISDRSGEEELYVVAQDGSGTPDQLTRGGKAMRYAPAWAPDGKRIAFSDKDGKVYVFTFDDRKLTEIAHAPIGGIRDYVWSPRGNHLAWSANSPNNFSALYIWSARDNQVRKITDDLWNSYNPAWDPDGNYLYYLSDRDYAPLISTVEFNYAANRTTDIYALALRKDVKHPFPPESDEVTQTPASPSATPSPAPAAPSAPPAAASVAAPAPTGDLVIDFDGLSKRVAKVPVEGDNYGGLSAKKGHLLYVVGSGFYYGRDGDRPNSLKIYALKDRKVTTLADEVGGYALSADGAKVLVRSGGAFSLLTPPRPAPPRRRPSPPPGWRWTECPPKNGVRSSTKSGGGIATGSTWRTCTASTGKPSASATRRGSRTWPTAPISTTCSARWCRSSLSSTPTSKAATSRFPAAPRWLCRAPGSRSTR